MNNQKALFIKTKNIGDSIILTAAISALPKTFRYVDVICLPDSKDIFEMNERVRHVMVVPRHLRGISRFFAYLNIYKKISNERYDLLAQFSTDWRGALFARFLNSDLSVARKNSRRGVLWEKSFDFIAPALNKEDPIAEQDVDLLRAAKLYKKTIAPSYQLHIPQVNIDAITHWLRNKKIDKKNQLVLIHAASRWKFKEIPVTTWAQVIDDLKALGISVILTGSKNDHHKNKEIFNLCQDKPVIAHNFSLKDTAALFNLADLVVTIDSMSTHLASAVKTPVISIFGPTNEKNWGPWKGKFKVISMSNNDSEIFACRPCLRAGCEGSKVSQCLVQLDPKMIVRSVREFLH
jgi:heptosyltransferase-3